jgi:hypothetical protein
MELVKEATTAKREAHSGAAGASGDGVGHVCRGKFGSHVDADSRPGNR